MGKSVTMSLSDEEERTVQRTTRISQNAANAAPLPAQVLLGRYRVLDTNNTGGFGSVSVCWDSLLHRRVAIKRMPLQIDETSPLQASTIEEALNEARASCWLSNEHIVVVHDFEDDGVDSYLIMEYVDGLDLAELLSRVEYGVLSFDECAHMVSSLASGLSYAHENGVLHLDIKPANIMIDRSGRVKLTDFGMASLASAAGYGGARGGTVGYMPPEQIEGGQVDERTDVFSLAVVVWEALTGSCPFAAETPEQSLSLIQRGPSPALSRVEPELAGIVEETLLRALDPSPTARMSSIDEFARDIVAALGDVQEGRESLRDLLTQTEEDEEPDAREDWKRLHVPLSIRFPWLGPTVVRALSAGTAAIIAYRTMPCIFPDSAQATAFGIGGVGAACAVWPPLGGMLGIVALTGAILAQVASHAFPLALVIGVVGVMWWLVCGRRFDLSGASLLLPSCILSPLAGVGLCGIALSPGSAFLTAGGGYLFYLVMTCSIQSSFYANAITQNLSVYALQPHTWILALGCGLSGFVGSLFSRKNSLPMVIIGQVAATILACLSYILSAHVEKASIVFSVDGMAMGVAVFLGAILCIAYALLGESAINRKGDDRA